MLNLKFKRKIITESGRCCTDSGDAGSLAVAGDIVLALCSLSKRYLAMEGAAVGKSSVHLLNICPCPPVYLNIILLFVPPVPSKSFIVSLNDQACFE